MRKSLSIRVLMIFALLSQLALPFASASSDGPPSIDNSSNSAYAATATTAKVADAIVPAGSNSATASATLTGLRPGSVYYVSGR
ncbi:hypothetical protein [Saccharibacillus endophyticus]|uniref:hypothetical protein n=1 Tax=Saccharibacillus endophyticus TaxID=2060666 RepID=UPI0015563AAD|nr:hypothetical protein [Saccharibacillus endophyticus]